MTVPFSGIITPQSVAFTLPSGRTQNVTSAHHNFQEIRETVKALQAALRAGETEEAAALHEKLAVLSEPAKAIVAAAAGSKVTVRDGVVFYGDEPINNAVTDRILWGLREGFDMKPYIAFLDNLMENPSKRAVDELYEFLERNNMGITDDGHLLAYKRVRDDFRDIHSGKFDNSPGQVLEMPRNKVDDDKNRTCSYGFHFCAQSYLPHFGAGYGNRIVIVKVNPRDVVSIPADYDAAKARACRYEVLSEYQGSDKDDLLATKPVWSTNEWTGGDDDNNYDDEDDADIWFDADEDAALDDREVDDEDLFIESVNYTYNSDGSVDAIEVFYDDGSETVADTEEEIERIERKLAEQRANAGQPAPVAPVVKLPLPVSEPEPVIRDVNIKSVRYDTSGTLKVEVTYEDGVVTVATTDAEIIAINDKVRNQTRR